jgi:hypothetical protein
LSDTIVVERRGKIDAFMELSWLAKAVGKDVARPPLMVISVIDGKGYASDGFRIHVTENAGIADGVYKIVRQTRRKFIELVPADVRPPNYIEKIPEQKVLSRPVTLSALPQSYLPLGAREGRMVMRFARICCPEHTFNLSYFLDALDMGGAKVQEEYTFSWKEGNYAALWVEYTSGRSRRSALVMSLCAEAE